MCWPLQLFAELLIEITSVEYKKTFIFYVEA